jgi:hypothetical protein
MGSIMEEMVGERGYLSLEKFKLMTEMRFDGRTGFVVISRYVVSGGPASKL